MNWIFIILLSIIQGATEFLPVSSSGHLVLLYKIFGIENNLIFLSVILHLATALSVVIIYRKTIWDIITHPFTKTNYALIVSTIFTAIIVLILKPYLENSFSGSTLIWCFLITAIILVIAENVDFLSKSTKILENDNVKLSKEYSLPNNINMLQASIIGIGQGFACFPGISRSGTTIACGLISKVDKNSVANYSFILSIPIILASLSFELIDLFGTPFTLDFSIFQLLLGFIIAFLVGLFCIKKMVAFVKKQRLIVFAYYLVFLSLFLTINEKFLFWF